jgi:hypothetical protein
VCACDDSNLFALRISPSLHVNPSAEDSVVDSDVGKPIMDQLSGWRVADKLEKRSLLIAINSIAALSIFFFGYDQ